MRANEFVIEGPTDWMQKQIIGRKQINQAKAMKQNLPKITKSVQEILTAKVANLAKAGEANATTVKDLITKIMQKTLHRNLSSGDVKKGMDELKKVVWQNRNNIGNSNEIATAISNVISSSLSSDTGNESSPELVAKLRREVAKLNPGGPKQARKYVEDKAKGLHLSSAQTEQLINDVLGDEPADPQVGGTFYTVWSKCHGWVTR